MPANRATLLALAERCEQAEGPDPQLDADIARELGQRGHQRNVTGAIDAADMLMPPGFEMEIRVNGDRTICNVAIWRVTTRTLFGRARTVPNAICAAALRALAENAT